MDKYILLLFLSIPPAFALFQEQKVLTITSKSPPYLTRVINHIYYIGTIDNGTLDCEMTGGVTYRWLSISKEEISEGGYVYSWEDEMKLTDQDRPWLMEISKKNYQTNSALVLCQGKNGYNGDVIAERIWVVTRLHSPLGYPTDPVVCGGKLGKCKHLEMMFRVECMPDIGLEYRGTVAKTKSGEECQNWNIYYARYNPIGELVNKEWLGDPRNENYFVSRGTYTHILNHKEFNTMYGEHNYCRAFLYSYGFNDMVRPPECIRWSGGRNFTYRIPRPGKDREECDVPTCSQCMYGDGRGNLPPYKHKFPIYNGTIRETFRRYKGPGGKFKFRQCYMAHSQGDQYAAWYTFNRCHYNLAPYAYLKRKQVDRPSCFIWKGSAAFETANVDLTQRNINKHMTLARCRIRQCTVRIVWFLFYNEDGEIVIDTQNSKVPRKFVFIEGTKAVIKYYVFGIHLESGLKVLPIDKKKNYIVKEWSNTVHRIPKISELQLGDTVKPEYTGQYFFMYHFEEADSSVELGTYSQMLHIEVRKPLTISLSPLSVHICEWEEGVIRLTTHGDFEVLTQDIEWSYAFAKHQTPTVVTLRTTFIRISENGRVIHVRQAAFIFVKVHWKHRKALEAEARVFVTGKPRLQNVSPLLTIAFPGNTIKLALATDSARNKLTWVHDAQEIDEVPDQPNMAFTRKRTARDIIYILTIDNILKEQFGVYTVKAVNTKNCRHSIEFILRRPVDDIVYPKLSGEERPIPLSNNSLAKFKVVMDFIQSDCADIIGEPRSQQTNDTAIPKDQAKDEKDTAKIEKRIITNTPEKIDDLLSTRAPYCISLQHPKPYFQVNLVNLTRIKGIRLFSSEVKNEYDDVGDGGGDDDDDDDGGEKLRLMYSVDGCKWKIFGAKPKLPQNTISNVTNETLVNAEPKENGPENLVTKIASGYESKVFAVDGSLNWIGNTSLVFAKHIRLVPANTTSRKESCIRIHIYGCPATLLDIRKRKQESRKSRGATVVLGVLGGLVGIIVAIVVSCYAFKRWTRIVGLIKKLCMKIRSSLKNESDDNIYEGYYEYYEFSGSEDSEEHIYQEIPDLESVSDNVNIAASTVENIASLTVEKKAASKVENIAAVSTVENIAAVSTVENIAAVSKVENIAVVSTMENIAAVSTVENIAASTVENIADSMVEK